MGWLKTESGRSAAARVSVRCDGLPGMPPRAQDGMPALCLLGWDADDRGYHIPAQIDLLGPVKQIGLEPVEIEAKIAEHHEGSAGIERVGRVFRLAAGRV